MKFRIRFADQVVGVFVLIAIIGIALILIFMGANQRWFSKNYYFRSNFPSGEGLSTGMPIMLQGFAIGKITKISLTQENKVDIEFFIQDSYYDRVLSYSVLELVSSPIGLGNTLKFHPGKKGTSSLPEHSLVPSLNSAEGRDYAERGLVDMPADEDVIGSVIEKVNPVLDDLRSTLVQVKRLTADVDQAITGKGGPMGEMVNGLAKTPERINTAIDTINDRVDRISTGFNGMVDKVNNVVAKIDTVSDNLKVITSNLTELSEGLKDSKGLATRLLDPKGSINTLLNDDNRLYNDLQKSIASLRDIIAQIKDFAEYLNSAKPQIAGLLEKGSTTLDQGNDVLEAVKNNPLLKGGVPEEKTQDTTQKTYRDEDF